MSKRLIQDLHAGISRRDWWAVEASANRLRDDVEQTVAILAGTGVSSLPNDYPLSKLAEDVVAHRSTPQANGALSMEALGILQEECAEVIQAVSKLRRSGPDFRPFGGTATNLDNLASEIMDVLVVLEFCGVTLPGEDYRQKKIEKLRRWSTIIPDQAGIEANKAASLD